MTHSPGFVAMVLAGGAGTRLRSVVADRCKPMALVDGEPFLGRVLDQLAAGGCRRAILCTGLFGQQVEEQLGEEHAGMQLAYSREEVPQGTAGALRLALPLLEEPAVMVLNGDSYVDIDLADFWGWALARGPKAALVAVRVPDARRYGRVAVDRSGMVRAFEEKSAGEGAGTINAGVYWFERDVLESLGNGRPCSLEKELLPGLVGCGLMALKVEAAFIDIGLPESYARAGEHFAGCKRRRKKGLLVLDRDGTIIEDRNYLADPSGVKLLPGVVEGLQAFKAQGFELAIITNQSGIGRGYFSESELEAVNREVLRQLTAEGIEVDGLWHCPHRPEQACRCRKPEPELLERALQELGYGPEECLVVGDKACDIELGARLGAQTALVRTGYGRETERQRRCSPDLVVDGIQVLASKVGAR